MPMVIVGVLLLVAKLAEWGPVGDWSWWIVAAPFVAASAWWHFSDASGLTKRREMDKMDRRTAARREKAIQALGLGTGRSGGKTGKPETAARQPPRPVGDPTQQPASGAGAGPAGADRRDPRL
jgi:small Trp-rich protein